MGPTAFGVHGSLTDEPILLSSFHQFKAVQIVSDCIFGQSLDKNAIEFGLVQVQGLRFGEILNRMRATCSKSYIFSL